MGEAHNDVRLAAIGLADIVDRYDARALNPSKQLSFAKEPFPHIGIEGVVLGEYFECNIGFELFIDSAINRRETARAEGLDNLVAADAGPRQIHQLLANLG